MIANPSSLPPRLTSRNGSILVHALGLPNLPNYYSQLMAWRGVLSPLLILSGSTDVRLAIRFRRKLGKSVLSLQHLYSPLQRARMVLKLCLQNNVLNKSEITEASSVSVASHPFRLWRSSKQLERGIRGKGRSSNLSLDSIYITLVTLVLVLPVHL